MPSYEREKQLKSSLNLMGNRLGVFSHPSPFAKPAGSMKKDDQTPIESILDPALVGINNQRSLLQYNGGTAQQERMIFDKRRTLDRAVLYSYQGALVKNVNAEKDDKPCRALINPDKNKVDYDDKIISAQYEYGMTTGDVFEWVGTNSYWLIYLQDLTELAYFRGEIRRCSYEISWKDENDVIHSTYAAIRGPVETKIDFIQKHNISIDEPNHSLHILMPLNEETLKYFRRYSKFYLTGEKIGSPKICWRVEAADWISTPNILEITAVEFFSNVEEDDLEKGIAGGLIAKPVNPNSEKVEAAITGETFIKPKITYSYQYVGPKTLGNIQWTLDKKYPVEIKVDPKDHTKFTLKWLGNVGGQMLLSYGTFTKTIVVESLF